jgi:hypothetical protein
LTDTIRCPWRKRSRWLVAAATALGALGALTAAAVTDLLFGRTLAFVVGGGALSIVGEFSLVLATVLAEDRATGIGVHEPSAARLVASWRSAQKSARRLHAMRRRIPEGPLRRPSFGRPTR